MFSGGSKGEHWEKKGLTYVSYHQADNKLFKSTRMTCSSQQSQVNNANPGKMCEIYSKLTIKKPIHY